MVDLPGKFRTEPLSYYVWSRNRRPAHATAWAIAQFGDAAFRWLTVRESSSIISEDEPWVHRILPEPRILPPLSISELRPGPAVSKETLNLLLVPEPANADRTILDHYLQLPPPLQDLLDRSNLPGRVRAIVVANTDRIHRLYPADPGRMRPFADVFSRHGVSMVSTSISPPYAGRYAFDIVLRVEVASTTEWRQGSLVVEKGLRSGEFRTGATHPLSQLPWYLEAGAALESTGS
jgi:hypothetical protein